MPSKSSNPEIATQSDIESARWSAILDSTQDAVVTTDERGRVTLVNRQAEQMFGYTAEELIGGNVKILMPEPYRHEHDQYLRQHLETGERRVVGTKRLLVGRRKDGEIFPVELALSEIRIGAAILYAASLRDATELAGYERARVQSERFVRSAFDSLSANIAVIEADGIICDVNAAWRRFADANQLGWSDYGVGSNYLDHCSGDANAEAAARGIRDVLDHRQDHFSLEYPCHSPEERRWFQLRATRFVGEGPLRAVITHEDVTARVMAELDLSEARRLAEQRARLAELGAITAKVVHDLGNSLGALLMHAQLLERRLHSGATSAESLGPPIDQIMLAVGRVETLLHELSSFAKEKKLVFTEIDVGSLLSKVAALWGPMAAARMIDISVEVAAGIPAIRADAAQIERVIENVIKNSIEAFDTGPGHILLRASILAPERVRISVEDDGPGIPENIDAFRMFETTKAEGSGLGLAVAEQIVHQHRGSIDHVARTPKGTIFHIDLPRGRPRV